MQFKNIKSIKELLKLAGIADPEGTGDTPQTVESDPYGSEQSVEIEDEPIMGAKVKEKGGPSDGPSSIDKGRK